jgi:hypothetical protein
MTVEITIALILLDFHLFARPIRPGIKFPGASENREQRDPNAESPTQSCYPGTFRRLV